MTAAAPLTDQTPLAATLAAIVGERGVIARAAELEVYAADALPTHRSLPRLAVFPRTRDELVAVVRALAAAGRTLVPRGAGTGLSAGALADGDSVLVGLNSSRASSRSTSRTASRSSSRAW